VTQVKNQSIQNDDRFPEKGLTFKRQPNKMMWRIKLMSRGLRIVYGYDSVIRISISVNKGRIHSRS
jgi:hypothetical protein